MFRWFAFRSFFISFKKFAKQRRNIWEYFPELEDYKNEVAAIRGIAKFGSIEAANERICNLIGKIDDFFKDPHYKTTGKDYFEGLVLFRKHLVRIESHLRA